MDAVMGYISQASRNVSGFIRSKVDTAKKSQMLFCAIIIAGTELGNAILRNKIADEAGNAIKWGLMSGLLALAPITLIAGMKNQALECLLAGGVMLTAELLQKHITMVMLSAD